MKTLVTTFLLLFLNQSTLAISEQNFEEQYKTTVEPFRDSNFQREKFLSFDGQNENCIYRPIQKNNENAIIIFPGRMEPSIKYFELIYDLKDMPFDFFVIDHRGQGFSDRLLKDPMRGHVEYFDDFTKDADIVFKKYLKDYEKVNIISHSMGGAIHLRFLQNFPQHKNKIDKHISIAPMVDINFTPYKQWQAVGILRIFDIIGQDNNYIIGGKPFNPDANFEDSRTTTSKIRWTKNHNFYLDYPELQMGSTTNRWTLQSYVATNKIIKNRSKLSDINLLIFQVENDAFVTNARNPKLCESIKNCKIIEFKNAKHAVHSERDEIRNQFLVKVREFLQ